MFHYLHKNVLATPGFLDALNKNLNNKHAELFKPEEPGKAFKFESAKDENTGERIMRVELIG